MEYCIREGLMNTSSQEKAQIGKYAAEHGDHGSLMSIQIHHTLLNDKRTHVSMC